VKKGEVNEREEGKRDIEGEREGEGSSYTLGHTIKKSQKCAGVLWKSLSTCLF
jgi:hypothetical protein